MSDYPKTIEHCLAQLRDAGHIASERDLAAVGFKTVAARGVTGCVPIDEAVLDAMESFNGLAPAHNPPYIAGIRLFARRMPAVPLVALFETAFHQWAPEAMMRYAVPDSWHQAGVRRWGYHGASHKFISERSAQLLGREDVARRAQNLYLDGGTSPVRKPDLRVISCHLGGSSSISGILNGLSVGNSMGMSPQSGLPHNNRVGDLDSFAVPFLMRTARLSLEEAERQLCQDSGLRGLSGLSNDMRDIQTAAQQGNPKAKLALDVFIAAAKHWIGAFLAQLNGADALVFTAGIGENEPPMRAAICANLDQLGVVLEPQKNAQSRAREAVISADSAPVKIMVIPTNEELVVAREARRLLENPKSEGIAPKEIPSPNSESGASQPSTLNS